MRFILEDKKGYGKNFKRIERADKRDRREARRAKVAHRRADGVLI